MIEEAKTGRSKCGVCREAIAKGELRLGEEVPNAFAEGEMTYKWHHLLCAAKKRPAALTAALADYKGTIPNKAEVDKELSSSSAKVAATPTEFPYADRAPTGRAKCIVCEETIEKGTFRIAIEREIEVNGMMRKGAGYMHPKCSVDQIDDDDLMDVLRSHSKGLKDSDFEELEGLLGGE
jgi:hypothetical protein